MQTPIVSDGHKRISDCSTLLTTLQGGRAQPFRSNNTTAGIATVAKSISGQRPRVPGRRKRKVPIACRAGIENVGADPDLMAVMPLLDARRSSSADRTISRHHARHSCLQEPVRRRTHR